MQSVLYKRDTPSPLEKVQQGPNKRVYYPTVSIDTSKGMIVIKPNDEGTNYEITGGAISNSVGFPCDRDADCDATLECKFEWVHKTSSTGDKCWHQWNIICAK